MRGDLVSRPIGDVLKEARALFEGGVKELLVISQDTSAYGVDVKYRTGFWEGKPIKTRMLELVQALGDMAEPYGGWVRLHYVYPYPSVDEVLPLMATGKVLPYLDVPLQHSHPDVLKRMKRLLPTIFQACYLSNFVKSGVPGLWRLLKRFQLLNCSSVLAQLCRFWSIQRQPWAKRVV